MCKRLNFGLPIGVVLGIFLFGLPAMLLSAGFDMGRESLQGLDGVQVIVRKLSSKTEAAGLTRKGIQDNVEASLNKANIKVLSAKECLFSPGAPSLDIEVKVSPAACGSDKPAGYFYALDVSVTQGVFLARDSKVNLHADTWTVQDVGQVSSLKEVQAKVQEMIGKFVDSYQAAQDKGNAGALSAPGPEKE